MDIGKIPMRRVHYDLKNSVMNEMLFYMYSIHIIKNTVVELILII